MTIRKDEAYGIIADGFNAGNGHLLFMQWQYATASVMPLHFGRRRVDAQEFCAKRESAIVPGQDEFTLGFTVAQFTGLHGELEKDGTSGECSGAIPVV